jgi:toxin ParE1/3/4
MSAHKAEVVLKPGARRDLRSIALFTGETWGSAQRDAYLKAIDQGLSLLSSQPLVGRSRDEIRSGLRSFRVQHHTIYYRLDTGNVVVLRILHARMDALQELAETME